MNTGRQRVYGLPTNSRKERDEDLLLFREMFKREKERNLSLLQPVSDEFEPGHVEGSLDAKVLGNYPLYRIPSGGKRDFPEGEKNDYDWLKTPPATPLFPSLETEAADPNMVVHKELPILRSFKPSRFSGKPEEPKQGQRPKSPSSKSSSSSTRSMTPNPRPNSSSGKTILKGAPIPNDRSNKFVSIPNKRSNQPIVPPTKPMKEATTGSATSLTKKSSDSKPRSRGISPLVRPTIPATIPGFPNETPSNLKTTAPITPGRASSATRGRPGNPPLGSSAEPKPENIKTRRQSCSPSVARGRKVDVGSSDGAHNLTWKGRRAQAANGTFVIGSRMVEKVMNARRAAGGEEKDPIMPKRETQKKEGLGFGRMMPRASVDMALKHMEVRRSPGDFAEQNIRHGKNSAATNGSSSTNSSPRTPPGQEVRAFRGQMKH